MSYKGTLVLIVGPSGAGKDSLITYARERLSENNGIVFARRIITRESTIGEDHSYVSENEFRRLHEEGGFALSWEAHGLQYGISRSVEELIMEGKLVVANGSRNVIDTACARFRNCLVVNVTAVADVLIARLASRGREDESAIEARLTRKVDVFTGRGCNVVQLDNSGPIEVAGEELVRILRDSAVRKAEAASPRDADNH